MVRPAGAMRIGYRWVFKQSFLPVRVDPKGRVFVGRTALSDFYVGDILKCYRDRKGEYRNEKDE